MTKTELWTKVLEIAENHKLSNEVITELAKILEPKKGGGGSAHPPKLDKDGNIIEAWCRYHQTYEPIENMVINKDGKSKGYCKAAASISTARRAKVKSLRLQALELFDSDPKKAAKLAKEAKELEGQVNDPAFYDLKKDWKAFNSKKES